MKHPLHTLKKASEYFYIAFVCALVATCVLFFVIKHTLGDDNFYLLGFGMVFSLILLIQAKRYEREYQQKKKIESILRHA